MAKWQCRLCGSKENIEAHHIHPLRSHFQKRFEIANGITLCRKCHRIIFGKELLIANKLEEIIKNGVNSGDILNEDNPELSREGNLLESATTRERGFSIEQFVKKQVICGGCGKTLIRHFYRIKENKRYFCNPQCLGKANRGKIAYNKKEVIKRNCKFCQKIMIPTPSLKHRLKTFCNNSCHSKWMWRNGKKHPKILNGKWTKKFSNCRICGTKEKRHYGKGLCMTCYNFQYNAGNLSTKTLPERDDIVWPHRQL